MVAHKKLGSDVDIGELAGITKNFSGAELEGLVRWESCLVKNVRSKLDVMTMDDVVFLKEAGGKKSIPSFRAAQSCALNRLVKADSKVEYKKHSLGISKRNLVKDIYQKGIFRWKSTLTLQKS